MLDQFGIEGPQGSQAFHGLAREAGGLGIFLVQNLMDTLGEVDTEGVEPLYWPLGAHEAPPREDVAAKRNTREELLANAADQDGAFFVVPRIV